jgi:hypothetical protein
MFKIVYSNRYRLISDFASLSFGNFSLKCLSITVFAQSLQTFLIGPSFISDGERSTNCDPLCFSQEQTLLSLASLWQCSGCSLARLSQAEETAVFGKSILQSEQK